MCKKQLTLADELVIYLSNTYGAVFIDTSRYPQVNALLNKADINVLMGGERRTAEVKNHESSSR